ncbi:MAG: ABC transporter substrate-binding protein [Myxococcales bacterium]|nr:ABC transporter substrate-binding protein [Myxococcales bacterium]
MSRLQGSTVKLGLMPPLSGVVEIYGSEIATAGKIACAEVNAAGGVLGRELELVIEDDGSLPESAARAAERLVETHQCVALIGNLLSNARITVAYRIAEPRRIPYLNFSFYEGSISSRYFFHFAALPNQQIDRMIPYMRERFGQRAFFAGNDYEWPRGSIDAAKLALWRAGGVVVGEEYRPIGVSEQDVEALLGELEDARADFFVPYFAGTDQVRLLTRFTEKGLGDHMAVVMGHYDEVMASHLSPEVRRGFFSSNTYFMSVDTEQNRSYLRQLARQPGITGIWPDGNGLMSNFGEGAYVCVKAFAAAANAASSVDPEPLVDALRTVEVDAPQGHVRMDPVTQHASVNTYLTQCESDGSFSVIKRFGCIPPRIPPRYRHLQGSFAPNVEERVRLQSRIMEQMSEAVLLVRIDDGTILYGNPAFERMYRCSLEEMHGVHVSSLYGKDRVAAIAFADELCDTLRRKGGWRGEFESVRCDGETFWCSASADAFTHPRFGEVWLGVHEDASERRRAELAAQQSEQEIRVYAKLQEVLVQEVNHRVRNNLAAILSLIGAQRIQLIKEARDPLELLEELEHRIRGVAATHDVLMENRWRAPAIDELAKRVVEAASLAGQNRGVRVQVEVEQNDARVAAHLAHHLAMVLAELTTNALKHGLEADGTLKVRVSFERTAEHMVLHFRDGGRGFSEPVLAGIRASSRLGIGLIEGLTRHSLLGKLELHNDAGALTTLRLPLSVLEAEAHAAAAAV